MNYFSLIARPYFVQGHNYQFSIGKQCGLIIGLTEINISRSVNRWKYHAAQFKSTHATL